MDAPHRLDEPRSQFWLMTMRCCMLAAGVDIAFFFIFHYLGSPILAWINVASVAMYAAAWWLLKHRRNLQGLVLIWIEVAVHTALGSLLIGWESGFHYYLLMFIPAIYAGNRSFRRANIEVLCLWFFYAGLRVVTYRVEPIQPISEAAVLGVCFFNFSVLFVMSSSLSWYYIRMVKQAHRTLRSMAITDPLTRLYNRRHMAELADRDIRETGAEGSALAFMLMDVDYFKQINDRYGHEHGDQVLSEISRLLKLALREQDYVGRWGGEEFLAVLPNADSRRAMQVAERVRQTVAQHDWQQYGLDAPVTLSIGISQHQAGEVLGDSVSRADAALYMGKHGGRNRVELAE